MWPFDTAVDPVDDYGFDPDLAQILDDFNVDPQARKMATGLQTSINKLHQVGLDPELSKPRDSLFMDILDTLDAPRQGVTGMIDALVRGDFGDPEVGTGWRRGQTENVSTADILRRAGVENPIVRGVAGFAGDVLSDPLSYLSLGTAPLLAKAGGRALSESGLALKSLALSRLLDKGLDAYNASKGIDEAFRAINRYQKANKTLKTAKTENVITAATKQAADAEKVFNRVLRTDEIADDVFAKSKLNVGISLPFLGHFQNAPELTKEIMEAGKSSNPIAQALKAAGSVFKPGRIDIADVPISDEMIQAINAAKTYTANKLEDVANTLGALPVVGKPVRAATDAVKGLSDFFKRTFTSKLIGKDAHAYGNDFKAQKAAARATALERAVATLPDAVWKDEPLTKEIIYTIDTWAKDAMKYSGKAEGDVLDGINRIRYQDEVQDADLLFFRKAANTPGKEGVAPEQFFRGKYQEMLADASVPQQLKDGVTRVMGAMDDVMMEDMDLGLNSFLEYYMPHRYINQTPSKAGASKGTGNFLKERKYASLADAYKQSGKIGDTDLLRLLQGRIEKSLTLKAQQNYARRLILDNGIPIETLSKLYKEALAEPRGEAAQFLKRQHIATPSKGEAALINAEKAKFEAFLDGQFKAAGHLPKDQDLPSEFLAEIGEKVEVPGMEPFFLPREIAKAFKETVAAKDILKNATKDSPLGKALLGALDHTSSLFRRIVTLPFPAYWGQNWLGDRFNQAMAGVHAMNPGALGRTIDVLLGKSSIVNKAGMKLDAAALKKIMREMGLNYSANDMIGIVDSFGKMNIDALLRGKNYSMLENTLSMQKGSTTAALHQLHDKFQKGFDGIYRASHLVHRFEQDDNLMDAARAANDLYFNYRDMSPVESSLFRRFYMFYGYMSKATKQTVSNLLFNPGNLTMQMYGSRALSEFFSDPKAAPTMEEFDMKLLNSKINNEQLSYPVGKSPDGKTIMGRGFAAPLNQVLQMFSAQTPRNMTVGELASAGADSVKRTLQKQFAASNPVINAVAQQVSGKNLYFDKPLDSEFLRKLPSLNKLAEQISGYSYDDLPLDLDAPAKALLGAIPDGKGRLVATKPGMMWILANLVPGMSRATSMAGTWTNVDISTKAALLRNVAGVNLTDTDPSRSYLADWRQEMNKYMGAESVRQRLENLNAEGEF